MGVIVWSGKGWLVPAVTFGASLAGEVISEGLTGDQSYYQEHGLPLASALWASAAVNGLVFWQYYSQLFLGSDEDPNRKPAQRSSRFVRPGWVDHSFMFINHGVWVIILVICGFAALIKLGT